MAQVEPVELNFAKDYGVTREGIVFTRKLSGRPWNRVGDWRPMTPVPDHDGYLRLRLTCNDGRKRGFYVHRIVLQTFVGPCPDGLECLHGPGGKTDNSLANIRWGTKVENEADKRSTGTDNAGERHPRARLTWAQVREIRRLASEGVRHESLSSTYGVGKYQIGQIVRNERWVETAPLTACSFPFRRS